MQYKTMREKEADYGEKIFKDFNNFINMQIKTLFKTIFCAGLVLTLVLYLCHLYGNYIEKTQEPITGYTYNGFEEKVTIRVQIQFL